MSERQEFAQTEFLEHVLIEKVFNLFGTCSRPPMSVQAIFHAGPMMDSTVTAFNVRFDGPADAPVVVLSNSLGSTLAMWDSHVAALARHFRVLRYDTRGHGGTPAIKGPASMAALGRDVLDILDANGIETVHFVGLSLGGMVGQWLLANAPERLERVVLANTSSHYTDPESWNARIHAVKTFGINRIADGIPERWFTEDFREAEPETIDRVKAMVRETSVEGYASCCAAIRDMDLREAIRGAARETLVIVGEYDGATPPEKGWAIAEAIPGARLVSLGASHMSAIEMPEAFTEAVVGFLTAPARRAGATVTPRGRTDRKPIATSRRAPRPSPVKARAATAKNVPAPKEPKAAAKPAAVKKTAVKKAAAKKAPAKKAAPKKAAAKKGVPKKAPAKKAPAKKAAAKKVAAKKAAPKKAAAKKAGRKNNR